MQVSRRGFVAALSASSALTLSSGFSGEILAKEEVARTAGPKKARILFNENPLGPSSKALAAIETNASLLGRYPLSEGPRLEMKLRKLHGLSYSEESGELSLGPKPKQEGETDLLLGIGSSEILKAVAWAFGSQTGNIVEAYPSYSAVGDAIDEIPGSQVQRKIVPLDARNRLDVAAMIRAINSETRVVVICNPNNPTGSTIALKEIEAIIAATPKNGLVLIDEAYIEYVADEKSISAIELAKTQKNVLVARTFSKIYGLAGLRVGYALGSTPIIEKLKPFMLGRLSMSMSGVLAAEASLDDKEHITRTRRLLESTKKSWESVFRACGWKMTPSEACFCWVDVGQNASSLVRHLANRDVLISGGQRWQLPNYVRISMGTEEENDRLVAGIEAFDKG